MKKSSIKNLVRKTIRDLKPYNCARHNEEKGILLNANENPFGSYNRYPDPKAVELRSALGEYLGISSEAIMVGNGSDEIIDLLIRIFCEPGEDEIVILTPTFGMYEVSAAINNVGVRKIELGQDFQIRLEESIELSKGAKILFLCSPNNPTANCMKDDAMLTLLDEFEGIVVVDEAYIEFAQRASFVSKVAENPNLVVLRTLSKCWGAAGLRVGYAVAGTEVLDLLNKVKAPYNVGNLNQEKAVEILNNSRAMIYTRSIIIQERQRMTDALRQFGLKVFPSDANFLLFEVPGSEQLAKQLSKKGVIVRDRSKELENCIRVSIGKKEENDAFLFAIEECLKKVAFIDRDGVIIFEPQDDFQIDCLEKYKILPGVIEAMKKLIDSGYSLVMVSNQNGIGTESFPEEDFLLVQNQLISDLADEGIEFDEVFVCPHFVEDECNCRKPKIGLVEEYLEKTPINYEASVMVGDRNTDLEFANNIGVRGFRGIGNSNSLLKITKQITS